jgi:hypothetical protein
MVLASVYVVVNLAADVAPCSSHPDYERGSSEHRRDHAADVATADGEVLDRKPPGVVRVAFRMWRRGSAC